MEKMTIPLGGPSGQYYDPALLGQLKANTYNAATGDLTGHNCPNCSNKGAIAYWREDGSLYIKPCKCMRIRKCVWEMERSGLKKSIRELTFDTFMTQESWQTSIKTGAMEYANAPEGWLLFCGQSGCGKTHLCTAVCRQRLYAGDEVRYMSWRDKVAQIKASANDGQVRDGLMDGLKTAGVLYIDDLYKSAEKPTAADVGIAFEIINYRYINRLPTIISTERSPEELVKIDEATGSRILEMAEGHVYHIPKNRRRNYRLRSIPNL